MWLYTPSEDDRYGAIYTSKIGEDWYSLAEEFNWRRLRNFCIPATGVDLTYPFPSLEEYIQNQLEQRKSNKMWSDFEFIAVTTSSRFTDINKFSTKEEIIRYFEKDECKYYL